MKQTTNQLIDFCKGLLRYAKTFKDSDGRIVLKEAYNKKLFNALRELGAFDFYISNRGIILGLSQIQAFLSYGWKAFKNGYTAHGEKVEVHHISGIVNDNRPENLVYLSVQDHQYISSVSYTPFYGKVEHEGSTPFNRQGRAVENKTHFLVNIIMETVSEITKAKTSKIVCPTELDVLLSLPQTLWAFAQNITEAPKWMSNIIYNALNGLPEHDQTIYSAQ